MSLLIAQQEGLDYVPKYLFLSTDEARETRKSRHVMKECKRQGSSVHLERLLIVHDLPVLRKRDSIRRQKQSTARAQSRVLPWLRREDTQQPLDNVVEGCEVSSGSPSSPPYETSSRATTPQHSQWTSDTSTADPFECVSTSLSTQNTSQSTQNVAQDAHRGLIDYSKPSPLATR